MRNGGETQERSCDYGIGCDPSAPTLSGVGARVKIVWPLGGEWGP